MKNQITNISVSRLFGYYNYNLKKSDQSSEPLLILYGDNGTGKTTLLEMLTNLTSTTINDGSKSDLASTKFQEFSVQFSNNLIITARRKKGILIGSYQVIISESGHISTYNCNANEKNRITYSANTSNIIIKNNYKEMESLFDKLNSLDLSIVYLSDNRITKNNIRESHSDRSNTTYNHEKENATLDIEISILQLERQIRNNVLKSTKIGDTNTNTIYSTLLKHVINENNKISYMDIQELMSRLLIIKEESDQYHKLGLISRVEIQEIEDTISKSNDLNHQLLYHILDPYVDLLRSRLDAIKPTFDIINLFLNSLNEYCARKIIAYDLYNGFTIQDKFINEPINFSDLSSGEKQLIILFCKVVNESNKAAVLIIDEPEISLNVKWQRKLVHTLLELSFGKNVQFVFSSHSIELLTSHKHSVCKLIHKED